MVAGGVWPSVGEAAGVGVWLGRGDLVPCGDGVGEWDGVADRAGLGDSAGPEVEGTAAGVGFPTGWTVSAVTGRTRT